MILESSTITTLLFKILKNLDASVFPGYYMHSDAHTMFESSTTLYYVTQIQRRNCREHGIYIDTVHVVPRKHFYKIFR